MVKKIAKNIRDTAQIAREFLAQIKRGESAAVIGLSGNLGAGKTAFVKAAARHLGVKSTVNSPTFVIIKKHRTQKGPHKFIYHIDAYRLKNAKEIKTLGWEEILKDPDNLIFIEWPENVKKAMPKKARKISIKHGRAGERHFKI